MATTVGLLHLEFRLPVAASLKDKRQWVKGFKDSLVAKRNVSAAEVDALDSKRRAALTVAMVSKQAIPGRLSPADQHRRNAPLR